MKRLIHIIEGRSGSGKTVFLYNKLTEFAKGGEKEILYLTPEQRTFECEKELLHILGAPMADRVRVVSFTRLYDMVMTATGGISGTPIDDGIRKILMSITLEDCSLSLKLYERQVTKPAFTDTVLTAINELKQCGILPDNMREMLLTAESRELRDKLKELALIYDVYNANIACSGVDPYDNDLRLETRIAETAFMSGYTVAVDDFSGFTAQQKKIISLIMEQAKDMYFSLCLDPDSEEDIFFTVNRTKKWIERMANDIGIDIDHIAMRGNRRTDSNVLRHLEENIYRLKKAENNYSADELLRSLRIVSAGDIYEECAYTALMINELAYSGKCRYRDIAVVFRDAAKYTGVIDEELEKCGIPFFMSKPQPVDAKPLIRLVMSALEYIMTPNDENKLLAAVKTGLLGIDSRESAELENYVFVWSIRGRQFADKFNLPPNGYSDRVSEADAEKLQTVNELREKLIAPFIAMQRELARDTDSYKAREISEAVYNYLIASGVPERLRERAEQSREFSDEELRLWDMLMDILNKMHVSLGDRNITLRRYYDLFKMEINCVDISDIPQTLDQVLIGKADSVRLENPYAVFVLGAVDGEFPHIPVSDGVFSDIERRRLISMGLPLYDDIEGLFKQEKFFVYNALTSPTDKLFVTYPEGDLTGSSTEPSSMVKEILRIFPNIYITRLSDIPYDELLTSECAAMEIYAKNYGQHDPYTDALHDYLVSTDKYKKKIDSLGAPIKNIGNKITEPSVAAAVFGKNKYLSATQVEKFYKCRFGYFCSYGAALRDRKKAALDNLVYGSVVHYVIENIIKEYSERDGAAFSDEELDDLLERLLEEYLAESLGGENDKTERFKTLYNHSKKRIKTVIEHMLDSFAASQFKPVDTELPIGSEDGIPAYTLENKNGSIISLVGKVDRVDLMEADGETFVRVVDYKSSGKEFSLEEVVNGINMQMLIYLSAITKNGEQRYGEGLVPAAVHYMRSNIGAVNISSIGDSGSERKKKAIQRLDQDLKMNGIASNDERVVAGIEKGKKYTKTDLLTPEQLSMIFDRVDDKLRQMSAELDEGHVEAYPIDNRISGSTACKYCEYEDLCRREQCDAVNVLFKAKSSETLAKLEEELKNE